MFFRNRHDERRSQLEIESLRLSLHRLVNIQKDRLLWALIAAASPGALSERAKRDGTERRSEFFPRGQR